MNLTIGSVFSGIGGLELGLEWAGLGPVVWQIEQSEYCRSVLARHWPNATRYTDARTANALARVDVVCGGSPCQDISSAGLKRGINGPQSGLWSSMLRIVADVRPRFVVWENVAAALSRGLRAVLGDLAALGYNAEWSTLSACAVAPAHARHQRERLFVVAHAHRDVEPAGAVNAQVAELRAYAGTLRDGWPTEPAHNRMADWVPGAMDRNRALGNAVVPQMAAIVGARLLQIARAS